MDLKIAVTMVFGSNAPLEYRARVPFKSERQPSEVNQGKSVSARFKCKLRQLRNSKLNN